MAPATRGVLVADDDPRVRSLLLTTFEDAGLDVAQTGDGHDAIDVASNGETAVAVLDVNLPGLSGYEVCRELRRRFGAEMAIVFVTGERTESFDRIAGLMLGADDYFVKPFDPAEVAACVLAHADRIAAQGRRRHLTRREREVLALLAEGLAQGEIAERLGISPRTVATHIDRILVKLDVRSRAQAVAAAYRELSVA